MLQPLEEIMDNNPLNDCVELYNSAKEKVDQTLLLEEIF